MKYDRAARIVDSTPDPWLWTFRQPAEQKTAFEKVKAEYAGTSVGEWAGEEAVKIKMKK